MEQSRGHRENVFEGVDELLDVTLTERDCEHSARSSTRTGPRVDRDGEEEADGFESAIGMLASSRYDLIVSDWGPGARAGLDFLHAVRADARTRETPVVMVASDGGDDEARNVAESLIVKPFNAATLRTKINHALGGHAK